MDSRSFKQVVLIGRTYSKVFLHLLKTRKTVIENWFKAVQESPESYAVPVVDALPLWSTFPTKNDPDGDNCLLLDKGLLAPFQEQMDRFLQGHLMQIIYRSGTLPTSAVAQHARL